MIITHIIGNVCVHVWYACSVTVERAGNTSTAKDDFREVINQETPGLGVQFMERRELCVACLLSD